MKSASAPATDRQTEVFDRLAGSAARWLSHSRSATILSSAAAFASLRAFRPSSPPSDFAHSSAKIASSTASIDGVLIVSPLNTPSTSLPPLVRRKTNRQSVVWGKGVEVRVELGGAGNI